MPLVRAIPNEHFQLVLEFAGGDYRLFDVAIARDRFGWGALAYPQHLKRFATSDDGLEWPGIGRVDAGFLHAHSLPIDPQRLPLQLLRVSYRNRAPTAEDPAHHVYSVYLAPFAERLFSCGESIGGGHSDRGGGREYTLAELQAWPGWRRHFELAGCRWAVATVEALADSPQALVDALVAEACRRNGAAEDDRPDPGPAR